MEPRINRCPSKKTGMNGKRGPWLQNTFPQFRGPQLRRSIPVDGQAAGPPSRFAQLRGWGTVCGVGAPRIKCRRPLQVPDPSGEHPRDSSACSERPRATGDWPLPAGINAQTQNAAPSSWRDPTRPGCCSRRGSGVKIAITAWKTLANRSFVAALRASNPRQQA